MLHILEKYGQEFLVNDEKYTSIDDAKTRLKNYEGKIKIILNYKKCEKKEELINNNEFKIKVRRYMTKPSSPEFDFHDRWNNGNPMPMRIMIGQKLKETKGMIKMRLRGDIIEEISTHCMKCGRILTNPISKYFGIGPECGNHGYNNPFETDDELMNAIKDVKKQLNTIKWEGWIIKSAIEQMQEIL